MSGHHRGGQQVLHRVREDIVQLVHGDVPASLLGMRVDEAARTVQDAAAAPVRDELLDVRFIREVGFVVVTLLLVWEFMTLPSWFKTKMYFMFLPVTRTRFRGVNIFGTRRAFDSDFNLSSEVGYFL